MRKVKFEEGKFYHIYNRGVEKRIIFMNDNDKWRFLQALFLFNDENSTLNLLWQLEREKGKVHFGILKNFLKDKIKEREPLVKILADCLMPNHYHLILEEIKENGISRFMQKLGTGYTMYFNKKYNRVGSLFQGPFKAKLVDKELYLRYLLIYINIINPGELIKPDLRKENINNIEEIILFAENYPWSTNREYLNKRNSIITEKGIFNDFFPDPGSYLEFAKNVVADKKYADISYLTFE